MLETTQLTCSPLSRSPTERVRPTAGRRLFGGIVCRRRCQTRARINISEGGFVDEAAVERMFPDAAWKELKAAYKRDLPTEARRLILDAVHNFLENTDIANNAPPRAPSIDYVKSLRQGALAFKQAIYDKSLLTDAEAR